MKKHFFILTLFIASAINAQTLQERVDLAKDGDFNQKLRMAMIATSINVLTTPIPEDSLSADSLMLKKDFAKRIVLGYDVDKYIYAVIATGQVDKSTPDLYIMGIISQMIDKFTAYRKEQ